MFSYQCSRLSTPQSVIEVFNTAKRFQKNQDTTKYVSVVVLDEVGLAEDSPNLPLKALCPLLEDGTEGSEHNDEVGFYVTYKYSFAHAQLILHKLHEKELRTMQVNLALHTAHVTKSDPYSVWITHKWYSILRRPWL